MIAARRSARRVLRIGGHILAASGTHWPAGDREANAERRIPNDVREEVVELALDEPDLSPRELAVRFTDEKKHYISEASAHRILRARDLITSPAFAVMKAADEFRDKTARPNELWRTDFTYLRIIGWGWYYLSAIC